MTEPRKIVCTECGFQTTDPSEMATHMITLLHCIDPELAKAATESGFFAEMASALGDIQSHGETIGTPVSEEDRQELVALGRIRDGGPSDGPFEMAWDTCEVCGKMIGYGAVELHIGRCDDHPRDEEE